MLNQKEAIERPDLAQPAYQRQTAAPDLVPAEPMPPRAGSDRVTVIDESGRGAGRPSTPAILHLRPAGRGAAADAGRRCDRHPRAPRLAPRPRTDHARGIRRQEARAPGADLAWPGDRPRPTWASGSRPPLPPSANASPSSPPSPRPASAWCWAPASERWSTSSTPSPGSGSRTARFPRCRCPAWPGHAGELVAGLVGGRPVLVLAGRVHAYEGYAHREVTILIRAAFRLGLETVVLTNAAGGLDPTFEPGELMLITDHINLSGRQPAVRTERRCPRTAVPGPGRRLRHRAGGPRTRGRRPDRRPPPRGGVRHARRARASRPEPRCGCSASLGADAVGMSTVLEVIVARHAGVRVLAISLITNKAIPEVEEGATHEEVMEMGAIGGRSPGHPARLPAARDRLGVLFLGDLSLPALLGIVLGMLAGITAHEFSHAFVADQLGDHRVRALGRVSLNPLRHLDPLGTALLVLVGIGWGKPVPVAVEALRPGRIGMAYVAAAGPVANVVVALILAGAFRALDLAGLGSHGPRAAVPGGRDQPSARDPEPHPHPAARWLRGRHRPRSSPLGVRHPPVSGLRDRAPAPPVHRAQQPAERGPGPRLPVGRRPLRDSDRRTDAPGLPRPPVPRPPLRPGLA